MNFKITQTTYKLLILKSIKGIGNVKLLKVGLYRDFHNASIQEILQTLFKNNINHEEIDIAIEHANQQISKAKEYDAKILSFLDIGYPNLLESCDDKPAIIFVRGTINNNKSYAVIGTRNPTSIGVEICKRITTYCVNKGISIVSGLATGIDSIAHQTALNNHGHTIAILGSGLDLIYPKENTHLAEEILNKGGSLISEYDFGTATKSYTLVARDRIQAAISNKVIMIESKKNGGSLHASRAILKYGRKLVIPSPLETQIQNNFDRVYANYILTNGTLAEKKELLFGNEKNVSLDEHNIEILYSKQDYQTYL